jgi:hypothetical protein
VATKERLAAMAASRCAVCSGAMALKLVKADPTNNALEFRTYVCGGVQPQSNLQRRRRRQLMSSFVPRRSQEEKDRETYAICCRRRPAQ